MSFASRSFWSRVAAALEDGRRVMLAVVAESSVHSPGTAGAKMFVAEDGERFGTIGGGVMELRVLDRAAELLGAAKTGPWAERAEVVHRKRLDDEEVTDQAAERSGMICAGKQTNLYALLGPAEDLEVVREIVVRLERGDGWWGFDSLGRLAVGGKSPLAPLSQGGNQGGEPPRAQVDFAEKPASTQAEIKAGRECSPLKKGESEGDFAFESRRLERADDAWQFTESLLERRRLAILGGGHCGQALARLMSGVGWHVSVWETRSKVLNEADLSDVAARYQVQDFRNAGPAIDFPELTPVVVMTTDVPNDVRALLGVLEDDRGFPFVGAMGSAAKLDEIRRRLAEVGLSDEAIARITAPVGLEIDSHTPPEIAVSVAAQLLRLRHRWL